MRKALQLALVLVALAGVAPAGEDTLAQLRARAEQEKQARYYAELVRRQVEVANDYFTEGDVTKAHAVVRDLMADTDKAVEAARANRKKVKEAELQLYRAARRLEEVRRTLNFDDQPPVEKAVAHIENARRELLGILFGHEDDKRPKEKKPAEAKS